MNGRTISDLWSGCSTDRFCKTRHTPNEAPWPKAPRSERDIFATRARGFCGVDPRLVRIANSNLFSVANRRFAVWCKEETSACTISDISTDKRPGKKEFNVSIKFWTLTLPCFNRFREIFYDVSGCFTALAV